MVQKASEKQTGESPDSRSSSAENHTSSRLFGTKRRNFLKAAGGAAVGTALSGCLGGSGGGSTVLNVLVTWDQAELSRQETINEWFEEDNPDIEIELTTVGSGEAEQRAAQAHSGGDPFDVLLLTTPANVTAAQAAGLLQPLNDVYEELGGDDYIDETGLLQIDGDIYTLGIYTTVFHLVYRTDVLQENNGPSPMWTEFSDYLDACSAMHHPDEGLHGAFMFLQSFFPSAFFISLLKGNGGSVINTDGEFVFDSPETHETLQLIKDMDQYAPEGTYSLELAEQRPPFYSGQIAQFFYSSNLIARDIPEYDLTRDQVDIAPIPSNNGNDPVLRMTNGGAQLSSETENPEAAKEFIKHQLAEESVVEYFKERGAAGVPAVKPVMEDDSGLWDIPEINNYSGVFNRLVEMGQNYGRLVSVEENPGTVNPMTGQVINGLHMTNCMQDVVINDMSPEEAAAKWQTEMERDFS